MGNIQITCCRRITSSYLPYKPYQTPGKKTRHTCRIKVEIDPKKHGWGIGIWYTERSDPTFKKNGGRGEGCSTAPYQSSYPGVKSSCGKFLSPAGSWWWRNKKRGHPPQSTGKLHWLLSPICSTWCYHAPFLTPTAAILLATLQPEAMAVFDSHWALQKSLLPLSAPTTSVKINHSRYI